MLEMKITIAAPDLAAAINNLAAALANGTETKPATKAAAPVASAPVAQPATAPAAPVAQAQIPPTSAAPVGAPLSATPAQTVAPVANAVPAAPVQQAPVTPAPAVVPTAAPTYTLEMIARAGTALVDAGKMDALCNLLAKYQVEALTALDPSQYGTFANELRALGAQI